MLSEMEVKNFKSFKYFKTRFNRFNVMIGPNASGKSNFFEIFRFLKDISKNGLYRAVYKQGGSKYITNVNLDNDVLSIKLLFDYNGRFSSLIDENEKIAIESDSIIYNLELDFSNDDIKVLSEKVEFHCRFFKRESLLCEDVLTIVNSQGMIKSFLRTSHEIMVEDIIPLQLLNLINEMSSKDSYFTLLHSPLANLPFPWALLLFDFNFYNFDPLKSKSITKNFDKSYLSENGDNLAIILKNILNTRKREFMNLLNVLMPFVGDVEVEKFADSSMAFNLSENFSKNHFPSSFISDGTSNMIALIIALYFENNNFIFIEEPERNIHPNMILSLIEMMEEVSLKKQIFVATHSAEFLRQSHDDDIYCICRDMEGFSTVSKPADEEYIVDFLKEMGIEDLYLNGILNI